MSQSIYAVETIDWSSDCIWDAWLRGLFSNKEEIDKHLISRQSNNEEERFRVLEIEVDSNIITGGWIVRVGCGKYEWSDANPEDVRFMGR